MGAVFQVFAGQDLADQGFAFQGVGFPAGLDGGLAGDGVQELVAELGGLGAAALQQALGQLGQALPGVGGVHVGGDLPQQDRALAELLHGEAAAAQQLPLLQHAGGLLAADLAHKGLHQGLGCDGPVLGAELFKQDALVGGVLVDEVQGVALLHQEVGREALADDAPAVRRGQVQLRLLGLWLGLRGDGIDALGSRPHCRRAVFPHVRGGGHGRALGLDGPDQLVAGGGLGLGHGGAVLLRRHGLEEGFPSPLPCPDGPAQRGLEGGLGRRFLLRQHRVHFAGGAVQRGEGAVVDAVEGVALI